MTAEYPSRPLRFAFRASMANIIRSGSRSFIPPESTVHGANTFLSGIRLPASETRERRVELCRSSWPLLPSQGVMRLAHLECARVHPNPVSAELAWLDQQTECLILLSIPREELRRVSRDFLLSLQPSDSQTSKVVEMVMSKDKPPTGEELTAVCSELWIS